jgi:hypothetical protein
VDIDEIGVDTDALYCHTNQGGCCSGTNRRGEWYFPNGTKVGFGGQTEDELYRDRASQAVRLNYRQEHTITPRGLYRCTIPYVMGTATPAQTISVNIGTLSRRAYFNFCAIRDHSISSSVVPWPCSEHRCSNNLSSCYHYWKY